MILKTMGLNLLYKTDAIQTAAPYPRVWSHLILFLAVISPRGSLQFISTIVPCSEIPTIVNCIVLPELESWFSIWLSGSEISDGGS